MAEPFVVRNPLVAGNKTPGQVTNDISAPLERKPGALWWAAFVPAVLALILGVVTVTYQIATGIGTWGLNKTVGWAFDITNFVFWVGIGHAGTLISAVLFLVRQRWRTAVNRSAEAMTIFAVICAAYLPDHPHGRPLGWRSGCCRIRTFAVPLWVNFRSPLLVGRVRYFCTYLTISAVFSGTSA